MCGREFNNYYGLTAFFASYISIQNKVYGIILRSDSESSIAQIVALAKKLNVAFEPKDTVARLETRRKELLNKILNFEPKTESSFGDPLEWQIEERKDRDLPF